MLHELQRRCVLRAGTAKRVGTRITDTPQWVAGLSLMTAIHKRGVTQGSGVPRSARRRGNEWRVGIRRSPDERRIARRPANLEMLARGRPLQTSHHPDAVIAWVVSNTNRGRIPGRS